ncbi:hypothetical protein GGI02_006044, partial [Coemansia sp. RSA 2322]
MSAQEELLTITLVKYESGLAQPGIMPPKLASTVEITGSLAGEDGKSAQVVRREYSENKESSVQTSPLTAQELLSAFALVEDLQQLPMRPAPGGPDIFGANTTVLARKGNNILWAYNPGSRGCCAHDNDDEEEQEPSASAVNDDHKAQFVSIVGQLAA